MHSKSHQQDQDLKFSNTTEEGLIADCMEKVLIELGEDPTRQGLVKTPARIEQSLRFLCSGYHSEPAEILKSALFSSEDLSYPMMNTHPSDRMVLVKDMEFYSLCEHHMLPFFGRVHIAYIPKEMNVGLSKLPRLVDAFARRLQVQERLTNQICSTIQDVLEPEGVAVAIEASHLCMMMRGVQNQGGKTLTTASVGLFQELQLRNEFLSLIKG